MPISDSRDYDCVMVPKEEYEAMKKVVKTARNLVDWYELCPVGWRVQQKRVAIFALEAGLADYDKEIDNASQTLE